jgi:hypothetical protein
MTLKRCIDKEENRHENMRIFTVKYSLNVCILKSVQWLPKPAGFSFTAANMSKTFKRVNPRKAAGPDVIPSHVLRACAD